MNVIVEFHHRWWHHAGWWATIAGVAAMAAVTTYAALFEPPRRLGRWIPLLLLIVAFWAMLVHYLRIWRTPGNHFRADMEGVRVRCGVEPERLFPWKQVVEVHKGSSIDGTGFVRAGEPPRAYRFCNWFGEANEFALLNRSLHRGTWWLTVVRC